MNSLLIVAATVILYLIAYHTYGKYLGKRIFRISKDNLCPSHELRDNEDFVPSDPKVLFGHHFASIAGTGPIVGPAIALIWGWLPALLWIVFGSIFMGAVHDFSSLIVSMRNQGRSIGDIAGDLISERVKLLFLLIIFFLLLIVIAVFAVVIGLCFKLFPEAVAPVWLQIPIAVMLGYLVYKKNLNSTWLGIAAVIVMYATIVFGAHHPFKMPPLGYLQLPPPGVFDQPGIWHQLLSPVGTWVIILLIYVYIASVLPVQTLLQPRDYINSYQLLIAMLLLAAGICISHPPMVAPALNHNPAGAPPLLPTLFVIIACGAISGFHSLVSTGTSSKQCNNETDSLPIAYGGMLVEGLLAVFVLVACGAGIGLLNGKAAYLARYASWTQANGLPAKLDAFVSGSTNMISQIGIPCAVVYTIMGVFIVSFAATSLDSGTRIQRYIISEISKLCRIKFFTRKHPATFVAVFSAFLLAFSEGSGMGAMNLWPLFGCLNQLLAGLALMVITVYLAKKHVNVLFTAIPMVFMIAMTGWALAVTLSGFYADGKQLLFVIGIIILIFEIWMIFESILVLIKAYSKKHDKVEAL